MTRRGRAPAKPAVGVRLSTAATADIVADVRASLREVLKATRATGGIVIALDERGVWSTVARHRTRLPPVDGFRAGSESPRAVRTLMRGSPVVASDVEQDRLLGARLREQYRLAGIGALACQPIILRNRMIGAVNIHSRKARVWSAAELNYLRFCARHIGLVLEGAERLEESNDRVRALAAISEVSALVAESLDLSEVLSRIANNAQHVVGVSHAHVLLLEEKTGDLCGAAASPPWEERILGVRIAANEPALAHTALRTRRPAVIPDTHAFPSVNTRLRQLFRGRAVLIVPLFVARRPLGVLATIDRHSPREFAPHTVERLETLAHHAAVAIHNARLHAELRAREHELKILSDRIADAHETERRRIARELHDVVGQALAAIGLELAMADKGVGAGSRLEGARRLVRETAQAARRLSAELHPGILDDLGLVPALRWYCGEFSRRSGLRITLEAGRVPELAPAAAVVFYRAAQEGLSNVLRHADAKFVSISLHLDGALVRLEVRDDGRGIVPVSRRKRPGVGLLAIRERTSALGGATRLEPAAGGGTQLVLELPLSRAKTPLDEPSARPAR